MIKHKTTERAITFCLENLTWRFDTTYDKAITNIKERLNKIDDPTFKSEVLIVCEWMNKINTYDGILNISPYNAVIVIELFCVSE